MALALTAETHPDECLKLVELVARDADVARYMKAVAAQGRQPVVDEYAAALRWLEDQAYGDSTTRTHEACHPPVWRLTQEDHPRHFDSFPAYMGRSPRKVGTVTDPVPTLRGDRPI